VRLAVEPHIAVSESEYVHGLRKYLHTSNHNAVFLSSMYTARTFIGITRG
jgi:hypothetical protein